MPSRGRSSLTNAYDDVWEVSGDYQDWMARVGGVEVANGAQQKSNRQVIAQIAEIEARQARAVREAALGSPQYLQQVEAQIQALRATFVL